jgi:uncharacterized tellurite resistance protein B-like protein
MSVIRSLMRIAGRGPDPTRPTSASVRRIEAAFEEFDDETARYLGAFAYVLGRVAVADQQVDDNEVAVIQLALVEIAGIDPGHARLVAEAAHVEAQEEGGTENYIATRDFRRVASREQCEQLLRCLIQVAAADGEITSAENSDIVNIAEELGFSFPELKALKAELYERRNQLQNS